jgi:hypothetical protein
MALLGGQKKEEQKEPNFRNEGGALLFNNLGKGQRKHLN